MSYDVSLAFEPPVKRGELEEYLFRRLGWQPNGAKLSYCYDRFQRDGTFFSAVGEANFFGKVKSLRWSLCYGGTLAEATLFAEHVERLASRFPANVVDPQVGGVVGSARAEIPAKWLEANLWSLGNYEEGRWEVRSPRGYTRLPDGTLMLVEALAGPHRVNNLLTVACGYSRVQDYERANRVMGMVLEEDPGLPAGHFLLGVGHSQLGDLDAARRHLKETLRLDPQHQAAREVLQELGAA